MSIVDTPEARAGFWNRAAAAGIDAAAAFVVALLLSSTVGVFFARRAVVTLRIGKPDTFWQGPIPLMLGVVGEVVYLLPFALLLVWIAEPFVGATIGKRILSLRVRARDGGSAPGASRWSRSGIETIGLWGWTLALLAGSWQLAVLASAAGIIVFAGCFAALGPASLTLHDRLSRTSVRKVRSIRL